MKKRKMMSKQEEIQSEKENKMGYMPMNRLLIGMATPMIISMLFTAFYNIVDSIFVARIVDEGGDASSACTAALSAL